MDLLNTEALYCNPTVLRAIEAANQDLTDEQAARFKQLLEGMVQVLAGVGDVFELVLSKDSTPEGLSLALVECVRTQIATQQGEQDV